MLLMEVLDKPTKWKTTHADGNDYQAAFKVGNVVYEFEAFWDEDDDTEFIEIEFTAYPKGKQPTSKLSRDGNAIVVFATVKDIVTKYTKKYKPKVLRFTAKEPSRIKLYDRLAEIFRAGGYKPSTEQDSGQGKVYWFERK